MNISNAPCPRCAHDIPCPARSNIELLPSVPHHSTHAHSSPGPTLFTWAILILLVWLPLPLGSNRDWAISLFLVLIGLLAVIKAATRLRAPLQQTRSPALPRTAWLPLALLCAAQLWVFAQWAFNLSADSGETFRYLMLGIGYTLLYCLVLMEFNSRKKLTLLLMVLVISGTLQAFYGSLIRLSGSEWVLFGPRSDYGARGVATSGTFLNRNHLAGYLEMTIACGVGLMLAQRKGERITLVGILELLLSNKFLLRLALAIMVIALVLTQSRMGNTGFFTSLLIIGGLFVLITREHRLRNGLILASLIAIDVLIVSQYFGLEKLRDRIVETRFEDVVVEGEVILKENVDRDDVARYVMVQFLERPFIGFGAGTFETTFQKYPGPEIGKDFDHAHNDYLQFVTEFGLIGALPLALFALLSLSHALRAMWNRRSYYRSGVGFGAAMAILALLIHSIADFNLQIPANAATFITLCAVAILAKEHRGPGRGEG